MTKIVNLAFIGSRKIDEFGKARVENVMKAIIYSLGDATPVIKQGGANGVDRVVYELATNLGWTVEAFLADWNMHGKKAGPIRNRQMLDSGVDVLLAFPDPDSIGTWDCIRAAVERKIQVRIFPL